MNTKLAKGEIEGSTLAFSVRYLFTPETWPFHPLHTRCAKVQGTNRSTAASCICDSSVDETINLRPAAIRFLVPLPRSRHGVDIQRPKILTADTTMTGNPAYSHSKVRHFVFGAAILTDLAICALAVVLFIRPVFLPLDPDAQIWLSKLPALASVVGSAIAGLNGWALSEIIIAKCKRHISSHGELVQSGILCNSLLIR